ncbi:MAG: DUF552 domain-containing protein [Gloeocapsa sp. DLM2.Bin57]|nr:MAG: DUF552 domain-containing protein [Gloeocapsa sp. DLM2.Bin57]
MEFSLITLNSLSDIIKVVELIRQGKATIVILNKLEQNTAQRVIDWLNGYIYTIGGVNQCLNEYTFLFAQANLQITGSSQPQISQPISTTIKQLFIRLTDHNLLKMFYIPPGNFKMGSSPDDLEATPEETPQHDVNLNSFYLSQYPITQSQWEIVASFPVINRHLDSNPAYFSGANLPVERVSWYDAVEFCDRLSQQTQRLYRLPSEAEWEYACRGSSETRYWFGQNLNSNLANYDASSGYLDSKNNLFLQKTTPVNYYKLKNPFGLGDLHGNVWEWCLDHWHTNYYKAPTDGSPWLSADEQQLRVVRGGSWYDLSRFCRSSCRHALPPERRVNNVGFRIACASLD